ncbi:50S ribosomal protein L4 [Nanobdella aerobiophila]|uniref:50S ribosomal protein L4 n=1 Tax=Nanobdella aerobiophila TaxID=2586965 RepID=A0A915SSX4_9ARCH|nr:50S ribosomal protein L4 [Nanobdella aerobiophila]BBL45681.1 50S ribosomal protein L4 [Nanobdella aerobiophila]
MDKNVSIYDKEGNKIKDIELPTHFSFKVREDIVWKAFRVYMFNSRQPYGTFKEAGLQSSAWTYKRRHRYRSSYGRGISRDPRAVIARVGGGFIWVARVVPHAVKGRRAHPPKAEKDWSRKINKKEKIIAILSAISGSADPYFLSNRYTRSFEYLKDSINRYGLPLIISNLEELNRAKDYRTLLEKFNLFSFVNYIKLNKKQRAGKGKLRGRRVKKNRGILFVLSSGANVPSISMDGVEIVSIDNINVDKLAPGGKVGRYIVWSEKAIEDLRKLYI